MTRTSHYAWMALGGALCLLGIFVACRARDGNRAMAQFSPPAVVVEKPAAPPMDDAGEGLPAPPAGADSLPPVPSIPSVEVPPAPPADVPPPPPVADLPPPSVPPPPAVVIESAPPSPPPPVVEVGVVPASVPPTEAEAVGSDSRPIIIPASGMVPPPPLAVVPAAPSNDGHVLPPISETPPPTAPPAVIVPPSESAVPTAIPPSPITPAREPVSPAHEHVKWSDSAHPTEPPLAPAPGPVVMHRIHTPGETFKTLARKMLGTAERWTDVHKLNPMLRPDEPISVGTVVRLPGDACVIDESESIRPLPTLRPRSAPRPRAAMPLVGTFPLAIDDNGMMTLPRKILDQLGNCDTVLLSPGCDRCLWLTNQAHLDRLQAKLDKSPARESDVQGFKRLYYAQTVKTPIKDGRLVISDKLAAFAGLSHEVVLVGIDDHFEIWDAARWRRYVQTNKATSVDD